MNEPVKRRRYYASYIDEKGHMEGGPQTFHCEAIDEEDASDQWAEECPGHVILDVGLDEEEE